MILPVIYLLILHGLLGGADVVLNHEVREHLPSRLSARLEEALHSAREFIFAMLFGGLAWFEWHGAAVLAIVGLVVAEIVISLWDTLLEDRTRALSHLERSLHVFLFVNFGAYTALLAVVLRDWWTLPSALVPTHYGLLTWLLSGLSLLSITWCFRDAASFVRLGFRSGISAAAQNS
ncbi:hypothetical protein ACFQUU_18065 [Herbaspirillum sp. GCM10030257]|uniref:hypothetical protein n=1 Tax=Herbaspirillum sp. GCM10030257 TaxID=3273393 RepID=UPI00361C025D